MKPNTLFSYLIGIALLFLTAHPAGATNRTVITSNDSGFGSLRDAIAASADGDTIDFDFGVGNTISLTSGELLITHSISINGLGPNVLTVARSAGASSFFRIFNMGDAGRSVSISGLTISNGHLEGADNRGGGVYNIGTLLLNNCVLSGNIARASGITNAGGGIYNSGTLTMANCTVNGNTAGASLPDTGGYGGGIYNVGTLDMTNCTLSGNSAIGASASNNGTVLAAGGAIYNTNFGTNAVTLTNCTLSGNSVTLSGGANFANGGAIHQLSLSGGLPNIRNTLIAANSVSVSGGASAFAPDIFGPVSSQGHNLVGNTTGSSGWVATDKTDANAMPFNLGFLQYFGGQTRVIPLLAGSAAIDAGDDSVTGPPLNLTTDQRGFPRSLGAHVDIGAFEFNPMFIVTTISDGDDGACDSSCTLREAINAANAAPGDNTITFQQNVLSTIQLSSALPNLSANMTIQGPGASVLTIRRNNGGNYRIFTVDNGTTSGPTVSISGLTISNGTAPGSGPLPDSGGGGILGYNSTVNVNDCVVTSNTALYGGGIANIRGTLTISNSALGGNTVTTSSGALYNYGNGGGGNLTVTNSTFNGNLVTGSSGGSGVMENYGGATTFTNCTFYNNSAFGAGAIYNNGIGVAASVTLQSCTLSANSTSNASSGDILNSAQFGGTATLTLSNNIFKTGAQGPNFRNNGGTVISQGYNLSNDAAGGDGGTAPGGLLNATGDIRNTDPLLGALANNGGPTLTAALLTGSPAINHGDPNAASRDQRYYTRAGVADIGAFEFGGMLAPITVGSRKTHGASDFDIDLPLTGTAGVECRSGGANNEYRLALKFPIMVTIMDVNVTTGTGLAFGWATLPDGQVLVYLSGVANAQRIVVTLSGVSDGTNMSNVAIPMGILLGDTSGNATVNASDVSQTKSKSGQPIDATNFRTDVTVNGSINASDVSLVKSKSGTALP